MENSEHKTAEQKKWTIANFGGYKANKLNELESYSAQQVAEAVKARTEEIEALRKIRNVIRLDPTMSGSVIGNFDRRQLADAVNEYDRLIEFHIDVNNNKV